MRKAFSDIVPATEELLKVMGEQIKLAEVKRVQVFCLLLRE